MTRLSSDVRHHRRPPRLGVFGRIAVTIVVVAAVAAAANALVRLPSNRGAGCGAPVRITVATAADAAPAVSAIAQQWNATHPIVSGQCASATVVSDATVLKTITADQGQVSSGMPTIWIPDSSATISQALALNVGLFSDTPASVASTPVVFAARAAGGSPLASIVADGTISLKGLGQTILGLCAHPSAGTGTPLEFDNPTTDPAALTAAAWIAGVVSDRTCLVGTFRSIPVMADRDALLAATEDGRTAAVPATEQSVIEFDAASPKTPLLALPPDANGASLDYPAAIFQSGNTVATAAAETFRARLMSSASNTTWWRFGFRDAHGTAKPNASSVGSVPPAAANAIQPLDNSDASAAQALWSASKIPAHVLTLVDVDPSMAGTVGNTTLMQLEVAMATQGLGLFQKNIDDVGLWAYGGRASANSQGYTPVIPIAQLTPPQQKAVGKAITAAAPQGPSTCGLYDAMLAGYAEVQKTYVPNRLNTLIIFTDSTNLCGHSSSELLSALSGQADANRPIALTILDIGGQDTAALNSIVSQVGGAVFPITATTSIQQIFLRAMIKLNS